MKFTNNIAIGVGAGRLEEAARFFESHLGAKRGEARDGWIELLAGPLKLYLVGDEHGTPTFDVQAPDIGAAMEELIAAGCTEEDLGVDSGERFVRTPFGQTICVSKAP